VADSPTFPALAQELALEIADGRGRSARLAARFGYDRRDPWAVSITFRTAVDEIRWDVARDLLHRGLTEPAGEGDLQLWPSIDRHGRAAVVLEFRSPAGRLSGHVRTNVLYRFLTRTFAAVPPGTETVDLDRLVDQLTGRSPA
jgi:hypothetical protein